MAVTKRKKFGEILVEAGVVNETILQSALAKQKGTGKRLGQVLEELGVVTERDIAVAVSRQFGFKMVKDLVRYHFPPETLALIESEMILKYLMFPLKQDGSTLFLAMVNPLDMETIDNLSFRVGLRIVPCVTTPSEIQEAFNRHYLALDSGAKRSTEADWWTILVIEDQELVRAACVAALKRQGYLLLEAANGAEGLKVSATSVPHLIISDTVMPRMDGYDLFRALQANTSTRQIPVIALSAKSSAEEEAKLLDMGFFDFIAKPINPIRLVARVKRALRLVFGETPPPR